MDAQTRQAPVAPRPDQPTIATHARNARAGGVAALVAAGTFVVGIALFATALSGYRTGDPSPADSVAFAVGHRGLLHVWHLVTLLAFGVALVPLALSLHERLRGAGPIASAATAFGLIWAGLVMATGMVANIGLGVVERLATARPAQAEAVWSSLDAVQDGLGGGNELVGALWVLLVCWSARRLQALPRGLCRLGVAGAGAGLVTLVPGLEGVGMVFGLALIAWFTWLGVVLLRDAR